MVLPSDRARSEEQLRQWRAEWDRYIENLRAHAQEAWDTGRTFYVMQVTLDHADGKPPEDAAGSLQLVESIGWKLEHAGYVSQPKTQIPGGVVGFGGIGVLGKDKFLNDLVGVYTFRRPGGESLPLPPSREDHVG